MTHAVCWLRDTRYSEPHWSWTIRSKSFRFSNPSPLVWKPWLQRQNSNYIEQNWRLVLQAVLEASEGQQHQSMHSYFRAAASSRQDICDRRRSTKEPIHWVAPAAHLGDVQIQKALLALHTSCSRMHSCSTSGRIIMICLDYLLFGRGSAGIELDELIWMTRCNP